ncbi:MAG TPA: hypothetical protein VGN72_06495 [Tepidisphaeraceae bacterium]|nr:hypothetical protein [Tepidisphaeraceae bacterium]
MISHGAAEGRLDLDAFRAFARERFASFEDACNAVAIEIARQFQRSQLTFRDADGAINAIEGQMIVSAANETNASLPEPAWSIYLAFDAGEWDHGEAGDPVERYTIPLLKEALGEA